MDRLDNHEVCRYYNRHLRYPYIYAYLGRVRLHAIRRRRLEEFVARVNADIITPAADIATARGSNIIWPVTLPMDMLDIGVAILRESFERPSANKGTPLIGHNYLNVNGIRPFRPADHLTPPPTPPGTTAVTTLLHDYLANGTFGTTASTSAMTTSIVGHVPSASTGQQPLRYDYGATSGAANAVNDLERFVNSFDVKTE